MNPFPGQAPLYITPLPSPVRFGWIGEAWCLFAARCWLWLGVMLILLSLSAVGVMALALAISVSDPSSASGDDSFDWDVLWGGDILLGAAYLLVLFFFSGGVFRIALRQVQGEPVGIGDLFCGGAAFRRLAGYWLLSGTGVCLGLCLCVVPGLVLAARLLPAPALIAEGGGVFSGISRSLAMMRRGVLPGTGLVLLLSGLLALGLLPCGLGLLIAQPLVWLLAVIAARDLAGPKPELSPPTPLFSPSAVWPPPPTVGPPPSPPPPRA